MRENIPPKEENDAIRADISQTRRRMDDTLDRLADRFRPRHLLNDLLDFWQTRRGRRGDRDLPDVIQAKARKAGRALSHQIRDNPMPSILLGAGLAWLIYDRTRPDQEPRSYSPPEFEEDMDETYGAEASYPASYPQPHYAESEYEQGAYGSTSGGSTGQTDAAGEKAERFAGEARRRIRQRGRQLRERAGEMRERASERGHRMRERLGESGHKIRERAAEMRHEVQDRVRQGYQHTQERVMENYQRAQENLKVTAERHPLATGAACMGFGLMIGFLLPKSAREDEWFGEKSTEMKERVKDAGQDLITRGKHVAQTAAQAAQSEAERQGLTPEHLKESVKSVGQEARQAARKSAEEEGIGPQSMKQKAQTATGNQQTSASGQTSQSPSI
jgi:ElaB/YqjD/DUF883 family membrane-anchored ribosome-binding protein